MLLQNKFSKLRCKNFFNSIQLNKKNRFKEEQHCNKFKEVKEWLIKFDWKLDLKMINLIQRKNCCKPLCFCTCGICDLFFILFCFYFVLFCFVCFGFILFMFVFSQFCFQFLMEILVSKLIILKNHMKC